MRKKFDQKRAFFLADENFLLDFFENSPVGFHVFGPDRIILAMNQVELNMLGYHREEIVGSKRWSDLIVPEQLAQFEQHWRDISTLGQVADLRYTLQTKSGGKIDVILNASARFDNQGKLINTRGTVLDVSHFSAAYRTLQNSAISFKKQKEILEQQNRALQGLLANVEIEKQNLKNSVIVNLEQLIFPILKKLRRRESALDQRYLELLEKNFMALTSSFGSRLTNSQWKLTPREIEISNMVKNGFSTKSIADVLCVSERTVEHHRNHIRKKFKLAKNGINLVSYLKSM